MAKSTDKFYNMQVNLIKNGKIYAEKVAIKNIWEKEKNIFLDIYFHRLNKSFIFDAVFIHDIVDMSRDRYYKDIRAFARDFYNETSDDGTAVQAVAPAPKKEKGPLAAIKNDIVLLLFMARALGGKEVVKDKIVCAYIMQADDAAKNLSEKYLNDYLSSLNPTVDDFYKALKNIKSKSPEQAQFLLKEIVKICLADGYLHYAEKMYLADIIQALRVEGLKIPKDLI